MYKMIIDTETANGLERPLPYDIGYVIFDDKTGRVVCSRSFVVAEIFLNKELMAGAYYAYKMPQYWDDIQNGKREMKRFLNIRKILLADLQKWNVTKVGAYNMQFDKRAVINDVRELTDYLRQLFPAEINFFCIWNMACTSICQTDEYIQFIIDNNLLTEKGNIPTSAEVVYSYLQNDIHFKECHTGLEDVRIEKDIYFAVKLSEMEYDDMPCYNPWMKVRKYYKLWQERMAEGE